MSRALVIPPLLREAQRIASDPKASAWVSANAGSGKTHVLAQRVLRLLLAKAPPAQILGLTYTKAAAANMATRIFKELAAWTNMSDEALASAIVATGAKAPDGNGLVFARQLFARTIETPGGLKIQTLHAFCERLLQLFPFEANVPAHFKVVDEREADDLLQEARDRAIAALGALAETDAQLAFVAREAGAFKFDELLKEAVEFPEVFAAFETAADFGAALRKRLALAPGATTASIEREALGGDIGRKRREAWAQALACGKDKDIKLAAKLRAANAEDVAHSQRIEALLSAFFKDDGDSEPRVQLATKGVCGKMVSLEEDLESEQQRLIGLRDKLRAAGAVERSEALFVVAKTILDAFAKSKADRGALDFNDQVMRALALVTRSSAAWVLHKLDYGLDHLLVDEAQDTSPEQWSILESLSAEFFSGAGARLAKRTVFAVGDEKQSIFSFQGAAPEKFAEMKRAYEKKHRDVDEPFNAVPLNFSFRSSQTILDAVDRVFGAEAAWKGVVATGEPPPSHQAVRVDLKGIVELWPTIKAAKDPDPDDWRMPLDEPQRRDPAVVLANHIAEVIAGWLSQASRERVVDNESGRPRRIRPGDVMILVRTRNVFFEAMIRALKRRQIEVAGADRLMLHDHLAVMDLVAVGRAALLPEDDLTLASALKSPLLGLSEDQLYALSADREGSLFRALEGAQETCAVDAAKRLASWRKRAKALSPHAFYARLLGEDGGRRALLARLGHDAAEAIDEFLALALSAERREAPSLLRFLAEVEGSQAPIKRDMDAEFDGVRVLTVHASKGLEAPIVFLPDTCSAPDGRQDPRLLPFPPAAPGDPPLFAWSPRKACDCEAMGKARAAYREAEAGEHRRLLYVAMTRAAERLIVAGFETKNGRQRGCWRDLVEPGLADAMTIAPAQWSGGGAILCFGEGLRSDGSEGAEAASDAIVLPAWLGEHARIEPRTSPLRPSTAVSARDDDTARMLEGRLAHALLQRLPEIRSELRTAVAHAFLEANGGSIEKVRRIKLAEQCIAIVEAPHLADLFGPHSRAEVPLAGVLKRVGREDVPYSGRLDRMVVTEESVVIVDFKLGAAPASPAPAHVAQLALYREALVALYPSSRVQAALVYLDAAARVELADAALSAALDELRRS